MGLVKNLAEGMDLRATLDGWFPRLDLLADYANVRLSGFQLRFPTSLNSSESALFGNAFNFMLRDCLFRSLERRHASSARLPNEAELAGHREENVFRSGPLARSRLWIRLGDADRTSRVGGISALQRSLPIEREHRVRAELVRLEPMVCLDVHPIANDNVVFNPTFEASALVGGADGDLIVGDLLIEAKTTSRLLPVSTTHILQVIGYFLLDTRDRYSIRRLGLYYPRRGGLLIWDAEELLSMASGRRASVETWRQALGSYLSAWNDPR